MRGRALGGRALGGRATTIHASVADDMVGGQGGSTTKADDETDRSQLAEMRRFRS